MNTSKKYRRVFRNRQNRIFFIAWIGLVFTGLIILWLLTGSMNRKTQVFLLCLWFLPQLLVFIFWYIHTERRLQEMAELSDGVDRVLRGESNLSIRASEEGELSILAGELEKMTIRLKTDADRRLQDKQKMSQVIADIAHQLRTPLTAIHLNMDILLKNQQKEAGNSGTIRSLHEIRRSLARMENLVEALLKVARLDSGTIVYQKELLSARELVKKSEEPLQIAMELKNETLYIEGDADFVGDPHWTREAIGNILKNCMEHTPDGGSIEVKISDSPIRAEIEIKDNGPGIPQNDLPRLFERFYRGSNASPESVGIGLALARDIITGQNGSIKAFNRKDREKGRTGACFIIRFYK